MLNTLASNLWAHKNSICFLGILPLLPPVNSCLTLNACYLFCNSPTWRLMLF